MGGGRSTTERILDAATVLFSEKGYHATTMREIASAVGIKAASLYNHFPGKEDVLHRIELRLFFGRSFHGQTKTPESFDSGAEYTSPVR